MSIAPITSSSMAAVANGQDALSSLAVDRPSHAAGRFSKASLRNAGPAEHAYVEELNTYMAQLLSA